MKSVLSDDLVKSIVEKWGIDTTHCAGLEINFSLFPQQVARVQIHRILSEVEVGELKDLLETYHLVKEELETPT